MTAPEETMERLMVAVSEVLDDDLMSAPTTRTLAEHLSGESVAIGSGPHIETALMLAELRRRGALHMWIDSPSYFARDDDGPVVVRWTRTRAAIEVMR